VAGWECNTDSDCQSGQRCAGNKCVSACETAAVYFDFNESRIRVDQREALNANAECAKSRGQSVRIEGHCDERGTEEYNMALGERRATKSKSYLSTLGVSNSMRTMSYGEERPTCTDSNERCWSQNRRAEFIFE
jgi:peptidoglycan-associated lipoprotein